LLPVQIVILLCMVWINTQVTRRRGFFTRPHPRLGRFLLVASILYAAVMLVRYFVSGHLHPERRFWPRGSIPILFHFVLAGYLYVLSRPWTKERDPKTTGTGANFQLSDNK
jgi:hypothetical protein